MASRSLNTTESRYSNIERECQAVMYGLEKFEYYLLGREVIVETDHSPLEQIFRKNLADAPARLQRMLLRCLRFDVEVKYKPGKSIPVADALSRVCLQKKVHSVESLPPEEHSIHFLSTPVDLTEIKLATTEDSTMQLLKDIIFKGWPPHRRNCPQELWEFWNFRCDLVLEDGLVLKGNRIVIPTSMRNQVLKAIHLGHQGETKCILRARESVFWPGISNDSRQMVKDCGSCNHHQPIKPKLPIMQPDLPTRPWEKLGTDIFEFNNRKYLMIVDYYSRFPVMRLLSDMTANTICNHFTSVLAEYGLPAKITSDFGPQYISEHFRAKCQQSGITLDCSSPYHHQANSLAENAIGTCKSILKKAIESNQCPYTAIWMYRTTPLDNQMPSPYELLFGRKTQTTLPTSRGSLKSKHPHNDAHQEANQQRQMKQAESYNAKVGNDRRILNNQEPVYVRDTLRNTWKPAVVLSRPEPTRRPRTYLVDIQGKVYQRTREHLKPRGEITTIPMQIERCLPPRSDVGDNKFPPFSAFVQFVIEIAEVQCLPVLTGVEANSQDVKNQRGNPSYRGKNKRNVLATGAEEQPGTDKERNAKPCAWCKGTHNLDTCRECLKTPLKERILFLIKKGLCLRCLEHGHMAKENKCKTKIVCASCKQQHPTCLHREREPHPPGEAKETPEAASTKCTVVCRVEGQDSGQDQSLIVPGYSVARSLKRKN